MEAKDYLIKADDSVPAIKKFAILSNFNEKLKFLSAIAEEENWDFPEKNDVHPVLFQYIYHTFNRVLKENKVSIYDDSIAIFNTGLLSKNGEDIYCLFKRTTDADDTKQKWYLDSFYKESDRNLVNFHPLPSVADYYNSISGEEVDTYFDCSKDIQCNIDHIIDERIDRMPSVFQTFDKQTQLYIFQGAFDKLKKKLKRNRRLAVPQIYKDRMTYLLPMDICGTTVALAVERVGSIYRANTLFTLEMAYTNARLLATPDSNWLTNSKKKEAN